MNRKERRKERLYTTSSNSDNEMSRMIKILMGVVVVFLLVYFGFAIYNGEIFGNDKEEETVVEFQNEKVLVGTTFNMDASEYYVLYYDSSKKGEAVTMQILYNDIYKPNGIIKMYWADLSDKFNDEYIVKDDNKQSINERPKNISELKVTNPTLIKIKDKKVIEFITGYEKIKDHILKVTDK